MVNEKENKEVGFSGFDSMISDVDKYIADLDKNNISTTPSHQASQTLLVNPPPVADPGKTPIQPRKNLTNSSVVLMTKWLSNSTFWWIVGIVVVIVLVNSGEKDDPPRIYEEMPSVSNGLLFSDSQIRYCLSEDIRIEAMRGYINSYSNSSVRALNRYVSDYNSRCANFRYKRNALASVRREVESRRATLQSEGANRAFENP